MKMKIIENDKKWKGKWEMKWMAWMNGLNWNEKMEMRWKYEKAFQEFKGCGTTFLLDLFLGLVLFIWFLQGVSQSLKSPGSKASFGSLPGNICNSAKCR